MAITLSSEEMKTFKANLEQMQPYQDPALLNLLNKSLYNSSSFTYEIVQGLEASVCINRVQMYSRHNVYNECQRLCAGLPLAKLNFKLHSQDFIDEVEFAILPKRRALREAARERLLQECIHNEEVLLATGAPHLVDTSTFPKISRGLKIVSAADSLREATDEKPIRVTVYGAAAGHVVEYIHSIYPELDVNVVILNPEVTAIMLALDSAMGARFSNKHTHLYVAFDDTPIVSNNIVLLPELMVCPNFNANLKQRLLHQMERNYNRLLEIKGRRNLNNFLARYNFPYASIAQQLTENTFSPASDVLLVFPGPSLLDNLNRLKELKTQGVRIMACDSAMPALEAFKIAPDIVVCHDVGLYKLAGLDAPLSPRYMLSPKIYQNSALVFTSKTHLRLVALFSGKKYIIYTPDLQKRGVAMQDKAMTGLDITSSVSSLMVDLALKLQAKRLYFFGFDNICRLDSYHTTFTQDEEATLFGFKRNILEPVPCNDGRIRRSLHSYTSSKLHLEDVIAQNSSISFINCSPYGAVVKGMVLDPSAAPKTM